MPYHASGLSCPTREGAQGAPEPTAPTSSGLDLIDIAKRYGDLEVLDSVRLAVRPGEIVALLGPSGCGKTTLLDIVSGVTPPSAGRILWNGHPVPHLGGRVAYLHQRDLLLPWRTAMGNALLGAQVRGQLAAARAAAPALLARLGLGGFEEAPPARLSGGMRHRVALARTILGGGELWLLDEPFASVDSLTRQELQRLLLSVWDNQPALLVTHDVNDARRLAHRVVVLSPRPARVLAQLPARELTEERVLELFGHAAPSAGR